MSRADVETVLRTAALARIEVAKDELPVLAGQFAAILEAFRGLAEVDVADAAAFARASDDPGALREDEPEPSLPPDVLLAQAPEAVEGFYGVPKTVGGPP